MRARPRGVLVDHTVDSSVTAPTDSTSPLLDAAITHGYQHIQDGLLEEVRTRGSEAFDQLCCDLCTETRDACVDLFNGIKIRTPRAPRKTSSYAVREHDRDKQGFAEGQPRQGGAGARQASAAQHQ